MPATIPAVYQPFLGSEIRPLGWLAEQAERSARGIVGHLRELCVEAGSDAFATGRVEVDAERVWWPGEAEGNWAEGWARLMFLVGEEKARAEVREYFTRLIDCQDDDGYLGVYRASARGNGIPSGDLWTQSRVLLALLAWHEVDPAAGQAVVDAVQRAARNTAGRLRVSPNPFAYPDADAGGPAHGLMLVDVLIRLFDITGDEANLELACQLYELYSEAEIYWIGADFQADRLRGPAAFIGHGAHVCEHLRVPLLLYHYTGDPYYAELSAAAFNKIAACIGLSGACKSDECVGSPEGAEVPLPGFGYEFCAMTELLISLYAKVSLTGDFAAADRAEWLFHNGVQAATAADFRGIAYMYAENQYRADQASGPSWDYSPTHDDAAVCCAPNAGRVLPRHAAQMVQATRDGGVAVMFYGPIRQRVTVGGAEVEIEQETTYPFSERVTVHVRVPEPMRFPVTFRIPGWASGHTLTTDGLSAATVETSGDRVRIEAGWSAATSVTLVFHTRVRALRAVDATVALARGPLLYALPIPHESSVTRTYPVAEFADIDFRATEPVAELALRLGDDDPAVEVEADVERDPGYPWERPPVSLRAGVFDCTPVVHPHATAIRDVRLVPIGATTLRRTTFPAVSTNPDGAAGRVHTRD